jgi:hypothetical protein
MLVPQMQVDHPIAGTDVRAIRANKVVVAGDDLNAEDATGGT